LFVGIFAAGINLLAMGVGNIMMLQMGVFLFELTYYIMDRKGNNTAL